MLYINIRKLKTMKKIPLAPLTNYLQAESSIVFDDFTVNQIEPEYFDPQLTYTERKIR